MKICNMVFKKTMTGFSKRTRPGKKGRNTIKKEGGEKMRKQKIKCRDGACEDITGGMRNALNSLYESKVIDQIEYEFLKKSV